MHHDHSDDDDEDYKPASADESSDDEQQHAPKKARVASPSQAPSKVDAQQQREALWEAFRAGVSSPPKSREDVEMVEIETRYKFAGKDICEKKMVRADSEEAKQWLARQDRTTEARVSNLPVAPTSTQNKAAEQNAPRPSHIKPGPRKPRVSLISAKPKKLTMLEKSAMDWSAHLAETDKSTKEELEANRRSGGSLAKHEFLDRVGTRRQDQVGDLGKRRRR